MAFSGSVGLIVLFIGSGDRDAIAFAAGGLTIEADPGFGHAGRDLPRDAELFMSDLVPIIDEELRRFIETLELPRNLRAAIEYSLLAPGKRIRPRLVIRSCEAAGGATEAALPSAIAIEMVHCFSLIHDDLPAMDDDDLRRGRPASHRKFGEAMAILAGDALATVPYLAIVDGRLPATGGDAATAIKPRLVRELAFATSRMIVGQVYDLLGGFDDGNDEIGSRGDGAKAAAAGNAVNDPAARLDAVHRNKTGALIRASCRLGGIAGGASEDDLDRLTSYGETMGLMFQIIDDLLDVTSSAETLGKAAGKDAAAGKLTWPGVHGVDESRRMVETLERRAVELAESFGRRGAPLAELARRMAVRTR